MGITLFNPQKNGRGFIMILEMEKLRPRDLMKGKSVVGSVARPPMPASRAAAPMTAGV